MSPLPLTAGAAAPRDAYEWIQGTGMKKVLIAVATVLALSACSYTRQQASFAPTVVVAKSQEGQGAPVGLRVVDERPTKSLGHRGNFHGKAAEITTTQDIAKVFEEQVAEGLTSRGFRVVPYSESATKLSIEIRALEYSTSIGFWSGGVAVNAAMKAVAAKPGDSYEKMYISDKERRVLFVPAAGKNQEDLNNGVSSVLGELFADASLFKFLAPKESANAGGIE